MMRMMTIMATTMMIMIIVMVMVVVVTMMAMTMTMTMMMIRATATARGSSCRAARLPHRPRAVGLRQVTPDAWGRLYMIPSYIAKWL